MKRNTIHFRKVKFIDLGWGRESSAKNKLLNIKALFEGGIFSKGHLRISSENRFNYVASSFIEYIIFSIILIYCIKNILSFIFFNNCVRNNLIYFVI